MNDQSNISPSLTSSNKQVSRESLCQLNTMYPLSDRKLGDINQSWIIYWSKNIALILIETPLLNKSQGLIIQPIKSGD